MINASNSNVKPLSQPRELGGLHHQPAHVALHKATERTVRVGRLIRMLMMQAMDRHPAGWRVLDATYAQDDESPLQPFGANQPTVGEQAMIAEIDSKGAEDKQSAERQDRPTPGEEPGHQREKCQQVIADAPSPPGCRLARSHRTPRSSGTMRRVGCR